MGYKKSFLVVLCLLVSVSVAKASSGVISEKIYFLGEDGRHALVYTTNRTSYSSYNMWLKNREGYKIEDYLKNFIYLYPNNYTWVADSNEGFSVLKFHGNNFAGLERINIENSIQIDEEGVFHFSNNPKKVQTPGGHYGLWNSPDNFEEIAYTWVFPVTFEPVKYMTNRVGEWVKRHNTITYYGKNVNDLQFDIAYRPSNYEMFESLKKNLFGEDVDIAQEPNGVKVTVLETVLYPSGIAELSEKGKSLLSKVAATLKDKNDLNIIVEGHTDNKPIIGELALRLPTNWELASIRSINVIHFLVNNGVNESQLESRSFSSYRPVSSNDTEEGRMKNRRIELFIENNNKK